MQCINQCIGVLSQRKVWLVCFCSALRCICIALHLHHLDLHTMHYQLQFLQCTAISLQQHCIVGVALIDELHCHHRRISPNYCTPPPPFPSFPHPLNALGCCIFSLAMICSGVSFSFSKGFLQQCVSWEAASESSLPAISKVGFLILYSTSIFSDILSSIWHQTARRTREMIWIVQVHSKWHNL